MLLRLTDDGDTGEAARRLRRRNGNDKQKKSNSVSCARLKDLSWDDINPNNSGHHEYSSFISFGFKATLPFEIPKSSLSKIWSRYSCNLPRVLLAYMLLFLLGQTPTTTNHIWIPACQVIKCSHFTVPLWNWGLSHGGNNDNPFI